MGQHVRALRAHRFGRPRTGLRPPVGRLVRRFADTMKRSDLLDGERDDLPGARMGVIAGRSGARAEGLTLASAWQAISGGEFTDELLAWPPDVFALTNVLLDRSEAFRFALSPPAGVRWPLAGDWSDAVVDAAREWCAWVEDRRGPVPS